MSGRPCALLAVLLALPACATTTASLAPGAVPEPTESELVEGLPSYQSPGPNVSEGLHDGRGESVTVPPGVVYASAVVSYEPGAPAPTSDAADPVSALGPPDYAVDRQAPPRAVSIGNGGTLVLRFEGSGLGDGPGPDLFVFEIGAPEATEIAISEDGKTWRELGRVPGGAMAIDIAPVAVAGEAFHFVRLHDAAGEGPESPAFAGADIDAVGVRAGEARRMAIPDRVLFDFDDDRLTARGPLDAVLAEIARRPGARVTVEGHTDELGSAAYNQDLSERRAAAVVAYLVSRGVARERLAVRGFGAARPLATGHDEESRRRNRRVEIVVEGR